MSATANTRDFFGRSILPFLSGVSIYPEEDNDVRRRGFSSLHIYCGNLVTFDSPRD